MKHPRCTARVALSLAALLAPIAATNPAEAAPRKPTLGSARFFGDSPYDVGYGQVAPRKIDNGGVPSGIIFRITWKRWGQKYSTGWGRTYIYRPQGGYYPGSVRIKLRASRLTDHCNGRRGYRTLKVRYPKRPGGQLQPWTVWMAPNLCSPIS